MFLLIVLCDVLVLFFFCSTFAQFFGYVGIYYSSPTLGTAMLNLIPGFTFVLAVVFRSCSLLAVIIFEVWTFNRDHLSLER